MSRKKAQQVLDTLAGNLTFKRAGIESGNVHGYMTGYISMDEKWFIRHPSNLSASEWKRHPRARWSVFYRYRSGLADGWRRYGRCKRLKDAISIVRRAGGYPE